MDKEAWDIDRWKFHATQVEDRLTAAGKKIEEQKQSIDTLRYALKGMCTEKLSMRVAINPLTLTDSNMWDVAQFMVENHAKRCAREIEDQLGERRLVIEDLARAESHIYYLENHASSRGLRFTPYAIRAAHKLTTVGSS